MLPYWTKCFLHFKQTVKFKMTHLPLYSREVFKKFWLPQMLLPLKYFFGINFVLFVFRSSLIESQKLWKIIFNISYQYFVNQFFFFHIKLLVHAIFSLWMHIHYRLMNSICFKDAWPNFSNQFFIIVYVYVSFALYIFLSLFLLTV